MIAPVDNTSTYNQMAHCKHWA